MDDRGRFAALALSGAAVGVSVLAIAMAWPLNWATFLSGLEAFGTIAATVVALAFGLRQVRIEREKTTAEHQQLLKAEEREREERQKSDAYRRRVEEREERSHASRVFGWLKPNIIHQMDGTGGRHPIIANGTILVDNRSDMPATFAFFMLPHGWDTDAEGLPDAVDRFIPIGTLVPASLSRATFGLLKILVRQSIRRLSL